jgi:hypothetical protein
MSTNHDGGKGDAPMEQFDKNFESIFGKKERHAEPIPFVGYVDIGESEDEQD